MEYFRRYLILIRKYSNITMKPHFMIRLLIIASVGIIGGILADIFLPFSFAFNLIRSVVALITGISLGSYIFILHNRKKNNKLMQDQYYIPLRKRFSFRQRTNIVIIIGSFLFIFTLLSNKQNAIFTLKTSIILSTAFLLTAFARRDRNEFLKEIYEIPDIRDLEFQKSKVKKVNQLKEQELKDKEKEEKPKESKLKSSKWYNKIKGR